MNLELVNLNKHSTNGKNGNGLPLKKDTQVEIGDPYDEYFVPVNEHRKYMRYESIFHLVTAAIYASSRQHCDFKFIFDCFCTLYSNSAVHLAAIDLLIHIKMTNEIKNNGPLFHILILAYPSKVV